MVHHHGDIHRPQAPAVGALPAPHRRVGQQPGHAGDHVEMYFSGELPELEFEQGGKKYWVMAGLPGGLGFDVYPPGQKLTIYLQRIGFASGTPVAVLTMAKLPGGATTATVAAGRRMRNTRMGEGARRQEATFKNGSATFTYAGREYTLPLDVAGRHSVAPGLYSYENGVRTALLEYGAGDEQYLLLRVPVAEGDRRRIVPYLVLNGRIVPPIDIGACKSMSSRCSGRARAARGLLGIPARRALEAALHRRIGSALFAGLGIGPKGRYGANPNSLVFDDLVRHARPRHRSPGPHRRETRVSSHTAPRAIDRTPASADT